MEQSLSSKKQLYWGKTLASFFFVLFTMPLGHALMRVMESTMQTSALHYSAFAIGAVGLFLVIYGVFVKNDTSQTLFGFIGGLLFWTGWVEFLFGYYAYRYGVQYDLSGSGVVQTITHYLNGIGISHESFINGVNVETMSHAELKSMIGSRPEYLIMPATFGFWVMVMLIYLFNSKTGCYLYIWLQKVIFREKRDEIIPKSMTRHTSITTFLELNVMLWTMYLALMFFYDPEFIGQSSIFTFLLAVVCLIGSVFMFRKQLTLGSWGANIRMAIATVIIFWNSVEIAGRNGLLKEVWIYPKQHIIEMAIILVAFIFLLLFFVIRSYKNRNQRYN